jgi:hypothetical protein
VIPLRQRCVVCQERRAAGLQFCPACSTAYDRHTAKDDGTLMSAYAWVAKRARAFERRRCKRKLEAQRKEHAEQTYRMQLK